MSRDEFADLVEPLAEPEAKALIIAIIGAEGFVIRKHAQERMGLRALNAVDITNVLRAGVVRPPDFENGTWRYRVCTAAMTVVVAFRSRQELVVVTAWRADRS